MLEENKRKSLGRGLGALLGDEDLDFADLNEPVRPHASSKNADFIPISDIVPGKYQPRTEFDAEALDSLAESIREKGVCSLFLSVAKAENMS